MLLGSVALRARDDRARARCRQPARIHCCSDRRHAAPSLSTAQLRKLQSKWTSPSCPNARGRRHPQRCGGRTAVATARWRVYDGVVRAHLRAASSTSAATPHTTASSSRSASPPRVSATGFWARCSSCASTRRSTSCASAADPDNSPSRCHCLLWPTSCAIMWLHGSRFSPSTPGA